MGVVGCLEDDTVPCARPCTAPAISKPTARTPVTARLPQFRAPVVLTSPIVFNRNIRLHVSSSVQPLPASSLFQRPASSSVQPLPSVRSLSASAQHCLH